MDRARVLAVVVDQIGLVLPDVPAAEIGPERSLVELGATSIDRVDVTLGAMEALGLVIPPSAFAGIGTIGGLVDVLHDWASRG